MMRRVEIMLADIEYEFRRVKIECPTCKKEQFLKLKADGMVTNQGIMSLVIRAACDHEFHLYLDKGYKVRGYEKIDMIVASEMMHVDDAISSFMKEEGMHESSSDIKQGKLRNEFDRERFLETFIKFYRAVDVSDVYYSALLLKGSKISKDKALPVVEPETPVKIENIAQRVAEFIASKQEPQPTAPKIPAEPPKIAPPPVTQVNESPESPPEETSGLEIPFEAIKVQYESRIKKINEIMISLELQNLDETVDDVELVKKKAKLQKIREELEAQFNKLIQEHGVQKKDFAVEDMKAQYESRIKKINRMMIDLELQNVNDAMDDIELEKKKVRLEQVRDELKAQYTKFLDDHEIEHKDIDADEPAAE
jgi:hypothetical protein